MAIASLALVVIASAWFEPVAAQHPSGMMISEFRFRGPSGANDEFIELFNNGAAPANISGWTIRVSTNGAPPSFSTRATIPANTIVPPNCYYLVANTIVAGYSGSVTPNLRYSSSAGFADDGGVALTTNVGSEIVDQVGQGTQPTAFGEGTRLPMLITNANRGIERRPGGTAGHADTDDNANDFREIFPGRPQNSSTCLVPQQIGVTASASAPSLPQGDDLVVFGLVAPGTLPPSTGITVNGDLSDVGGLANVTLLDDGAAPDLVANDGIYTTSVNVPLDTPLGARAVTLTAADAQGRSASHTIAVTVNPPAVVYLPHQVQGAGAVSPIAPGDSASVRGVVTARKSNGFFVQTEAGLEDADPNTSEGLFVFTGGTPPVDAQVGRTVLVTAAVAELVPTADTLSPSITAVAGIVALFDLGPGSAGTPVDLTSAELSDAGALDQLERFEGMRVHVASLTAVSGTGSVGNNGTLSDGAFYAVLTGQARPFRAPGVESGYPLPPCAGGSCNVPQFDGNPERLRVDSDALEATAPVSLSTGAVMTGLTGPLDFEHRTYTVLAEGWSSLAGGSSLTAAAPAASNQFTTASLNLGLNSANAAVQIAKGSSMIRGVLNSPDIIAVQDVESVALLAALASAIDTDAAADGQPAPGYAAHEGFLLKSGVTALSVEQVGAAETFVDPADSNTYPVFDRLPVLLRATVSGPATELPQTLSVFAADLAPIDGADNESVRAKRQAQATALANFVQDRQSADPSEAIVTLGNFNAFAFNDGYADVVGTVLGTPAPPEQVATAAADVVSPDLVNVSDLVAGGDRYSLVANGNAQAFDHVLVSASVAPQFVGAVRPRVNADFADDLRTDGSTPSRLSDRDPVVAYFSFPPDVTAPVLANIPDDQLAEAAGQGGAAVSFGMPQATDNLDPSVTVSCSPASGSVFPLGNSGVTCSAQDAAGNVAAASFTVTVQDTTAPTLSLPAGINQQTASPSGAAVSFSATAVDAVTPALTVACTPASGSTFAVGDTVVTCAAADMAGNVATGSFVVTVTSVATAPVSGHMAGIGALIEGNQRAWFAFDVRETSHFERGWVWLQLRGGHNRPDRYLAANVTGVQMSNSPNYAPSRKGRPAVDTVVFSGTGWWNGRGGYRFEITATDRGEPGRGRDTFSLKIYAPGGAVVESINGVLRDGNIESLR